MKKIKTLFVLAILTLFCTSAYSQITYFQTTFFSYNIYNSYQQEWDGWSKSEQSCLIGNINFEDGIITIYSPKVQILHINSHLENKIDEDGDRVISFKIINQDGDSGIFKYISRYNKYGGMDFEFYIIYSDIALCYTVEFIET